MLDKTALQRVENASYADPNTLQGDRAFVVAGVPRLSNSLPSHLRDDICVQTVPATGGR